MQKKHKDFSTMLRAPDDALHIYTDGSSSPQPDGTRKAGAGVYVEEEGGDGGGSGRGASAKVRYLSRKGFGWLGVFESEGGPGTVVDRGS